VIKDGRTGEGERNNKGEREVKGMGVDPTKFGRKSTPLVERRSFFSG